MISGARARVAVGLFLLPADSHQRMAVGPSAFFNPVHLWIETSLSQSDYFKRFGSFRSAINPRHGLFGVARSGHGFRA